MSEEETEKSIKSENRNFSSQWAKQAELNGWQTIDPP